LGTTKTDYVTKTIVSQITKQVTASPVTFTSVKTDTKIQRETDTVTKIQHETDVASKTLIKTVHETDYITKTSVATPTSCPDPAPTCVAKPRDCVMFRDPHIVFFAEAPSDIKTFGHMFMGRGLCEIVSTPELAVHVDIVQYGNSAASVISRVVFLFRALKSGVMCSLVDNTKMECYGYGKHKFGSIEAVDKDLGRGRIYFHGTSFVEITAQKDTIMTYLNVRVRLNYFAQHNVGLCGTSSQYPDLTKSDQYKVSDSLFKCASEKTAECETDVQGYYKKHPIPVCSEKVKDCIMWRDPHIVFFAESPKDVKTLGNMFTGRGYFEVVNTPEIVVQVYVVPYGNGGASIISKIVLYYRSINSGVLCSLSSSTLVCEEYGVHGLETIDIDDTIIGNGHLFIHGTSFVEVGSSTDTIASYINIRVRLSKFAKCNAGLCGTSDKISDYTKPEKYAVDGKLFDCAGLKKKARCLVQRHACPASEHGV